MWITFYRWFSISPCSFIFFKHKTAYDMRISDWSSDVCSSDLKARAARAPLALDLPERQVILDEQGGIAEIRVRDRLDSMRLIEDYMIAANVAAATALEAKKSTVLYRIPEPPSREKLVRDRKRTRLNSSH